MVGLPNIGTVGACAGKMVALTSPTDAAQKFNWSRVLKHEFVHVVNLQQTNFNIPHWFTEALAVHNEGYPPPPAWDALLAERLASDTLLNLENLNLAFVRPKTPQDWQLAYCQSELYVQYMLAHYGDDATAKMLTAYADNLDTAAALRRSFDVSQADFEHGYLEFLKQRVAGRKSGVQSPTLSAAELAKAAEKQIDNADLDAQTALAYLNDKDFTQARTWVRRGARPSAASSTGNVRSGAAADTFWRKSRSARIAGRGTGSQGSSAELAEPVGRVEIQVRGLRRGGRIV